MADYWEMFACFLLSFFFFSKTSRSFFILRLRALDAESGCICTAFSCVWVFVLYVSCSELLSARCYDVFKWAQLIRMYSVVEPPTLNRIKCRYNWNSHTTAGQTTRIQHGENQSTKYPLQEALKSTICSMFWIGKWEARTNAMSTVNTVKTKFIAI